MAPSNPLLKPVLKSSVQIAPGSRAPGLDSKIVSSVQSAPSDWKDWCDKLPLSAPALQPLPCSKHYLPAGTTCAVSQRVLEFPAVNPHQEGLPTRYVFGAAALHPHQNRPPQALARYDVHTGTCEYWSRGSRYYVGEPQFIPSLTECRRVGVEKELDGVKLAPLCSDVGTHKDANQCLSCCPGWVLSVCYDAERHVSEVVVLDASSICAGPVAWADLPIVVPHGLHGTWVPSM
jgi:carotenoid cleavage dioxygenase-like enzyme